MRKHRELAAFADFWPNYLREHSHPQTRALRYAGTSLVLLTAFAALFTGRWWPLPFAGYSRAWASPAMVERNRPATFTDHDQVRLGPASRRHAGGMAGPAIWSVAADFRMWTGWLTGRLGPELEHADVRPATRRETSNGG